MAGLKPEVSLPVALGTAALVYSIYQQATPPIVDLRAAPPQNPDIDSARRMAAWTAVGIVSGISLLAKDPTVFVVGGGMVIAMDWWTRHADQYSPTTGKLGNAPVGITPPAAEADVTLDYAETA